MLPYTEPTRSLTPAPGKPALTLDDAEWFKGELITATATSFVLDDTGTTALKACPGQSYPNTETTVTTGTMVKRLLRKAEDETTNWLFVQTDKGFGWLEERPRAAAANKGSPNQALN
jgi:hypothetical protein